VPKGWYTYDHRPRFGTNYYGLRNRVAILSEAYSHDPFERRVKSTYAFTRQLLSLIAERRAELADVRKQEGLKRFDGPAMPPVPLRAALPPTATEQSVSFEVLARTGDSARTQPGVPRGLRRTGEFRTRPMPVFDRFVPTLAVPPVLGYLVSASDTATLARLRLHGIHTTPMPTVDHADEFVVDSIVRAPRPFQGHNEVRLVGRWRAATELPRDMVLVQAPGPLLALAMYLLDPESDDSFATWNQLDDRVALGRPYPVLRIGLTTLRSR
jgi:hypothetical protein